MKNAIRRIVLSAFVLLSVSGTAFAHPAGPGGHQPWAGWLHPLFGLDHLVMLAAVGLWAAQTGGKATWRFPLMLSSGILLGGIMGLAGAGLPGVEFMIICSLLVVGLIIAVGRDIPSVVSLTVIGGFALFHGYAHGSELVAPSNGIFFLIGLALASGLIAVSFHALAIQIRQNDRERWLRFTGLSIALAGGVLALV